MSKIRNLITKIRHVRWSPWFGWAIWGSAAFMGHPNLATVVVQFCVLAPLIYLTIKLARHEGRVLQKDADSAFVVTAKKTP